MNTMDILVPHLPESVMDATVATWHKKVGEFVNRDELLVELETDKIMLEITSQESGILENIFEQEGENVIAGQVIGRLKLDTNNNQKDILSNEENNQDVTITIPGKSAEEDVATNGNLSSNICDSNLDYNMNADLNEEIKNEQYITSKSLHQDQSIKQRYCSTDNNIDSIISSSMIDETKDVRMPMTRIRKRIAERLLEVKNNTAILTTFNEVNMKPIIDIRKKYGEDFEKRHNIRLGFMSFYVKAVCESLKKFPEINASIDGEDIIYHKYFDISIAISTERGLVTPVLRNADSMSLADIEHQIKYMAIKCREGKITIEELSGGCFTITNGGIFGSLMSTPIINPPQSGILGMHMIQNRPVAIDEQVVILPMMYLAFSYDHCLIDGKDSVSFLLELKKMLEDPIRFLLEI